MQVSYKLLNMSYHQPLTTQHGGNIWVPENGLDRELETIALIRAKKASASGKIRASCHNAKLDQADLGDGAKRQCLKPGLWASTEISLAFARKLFTRHRHR